MPRFYTESRTVIQDTLVKVIQFLREQPQPFASFDVVKSLFHKINWKRAMKYSLVQKYLITEAVAYRKVYPDASEKVWQAKKLGENGEKLEKQASVICIFFPVLENR